MTNITDIRKDLIDVFNGLVDGTMESKEANEINNTAGKIISSVKVQLMYHAMRKENPSIPFLDTEPEQPVIEGKTVKKLRNR